jgi:hypothetical protein
MYCIKEGGMTKNESNSSVLILVAIIGAAATIAAAIIGRGSGIQTGREQAGIIRETVVVTRVITADPAPNLTDSSADIPDSAQTPNSPDVPTTAPEPTPIPEPTVPPATPTPIPEPTVPPATPTPNITASGTVLMLGETWKGDGFDITMKSNRRVATQISIYFEIKSTKKQPVAIKYNLENVIFSADNGAYIEDKHECKEQTSQFNPGEQRTMYCWRYDSIYADIDLTDPSLNFITVTVTDFPGIPIAQWNIEIPH